MTYFVGTNIQATTVRTAAQLATWNSFSMVAHIAQLANKIAGAGDAEALPIRSIAYSRCEATHIHTWQANDIMVIQTKHFG